MPVAAIYLGESMVKQVRVVRVNNHEGQFNYLGRWVNKEHFRAFVYNEKGEQKLASSYKEFHDLTTSGIWFASKVEVTPKRKPKDVIRADS